ncbi:MAG: sugar ABC transporter ATP-binding protein [Fibrobacteria bacterium]
MSSPLLRVRGVRKAFGAAQALRGADLEVMPGEIHALVGENGAGKSTLMAILGGALRPDAGDVEFAGSPWRPTGPAEARAGGIALVHQELAVCPHLSVEANVVLGSEKSRFGFALSQARRVRAVLADLGYPDLDPAARVDSLSMAQRQIAEIARGLFHDARLILMDEPTAALPARDVERLFAALRGMKARGISVIYISHFLDEVARIADRVTVLRDGATAAAGLSSDAPPAEILAAMAGRPLGEIYPARAGNLGDTVPDTVLEARGWVSRAGAAPADFSLRKGQVLGLAGLAGSGRSALLRSLYGLRAPASGSLTIRGTRRDAGAWTLARARAAGIGFVSEDRKDEGLALNLSVRANATLGNLDRFSGAGGRLRLRAEAAAVRDLAEAMRLRYRDPEQAVGELSGGNQQKVALGRLWLGDADIWLLDEPTRGVDVGAKAEIYRLIAEQSSRGKAVIWAGSYLPELFGVCDALAVLHRGALSQVRPIADWTEASVLTWAATGTLDTGCAA